MKIGLFTDSYLPAHDGVATSVSSVAKELTKMGHDVYIVAPYYPHYRDTKKIYRIFSVQLYKQLGTRVALEIPEPALLKISAIDFDIIHGHSGGAISFIGWQLALLQNVPFVETYHTLWRYYRHYLLFPRLFKPGFIKYISALFGNECDALIAPSAKVRTELLSYGVRRPVYVIPSGIEREKFLHTKKGYLHERLKLPHTTRIILSVGRLEKEKSMDFLIKVFAAVHAACPDTIFVIIGEGRDRQKLQHMATSYGLENKVYLVGVIPYNDMPKVYADADVFVFASHTETQGIVVIEALASGVPVIAVDDAAFDGVVKDKVNGYLLKKHVDMFSKKVVAVMHDETLRQRLSQHARASSFKFSAASTAMSLEKVYRELLEKKKSSPHRNFFRTLVSIVTHIP